MTMALMLLLLELLLLRFLRRLLLLWILTAVGIRGWGQRVFRLHVGPTPRWQRGGGGQRGGGRHVYDCLLACAMTSERIHGIPACNRRPSTDPAAGSESLERQTSSERWSTHFTHFPLHVREKKPGVVSLTVDAKRCC